MAEIFYCKELKKKGKRNDWIVVRWSDYYKVEQENELFQAKIEILLRKNKVLADIIDQLQQLESDSETTDSEQQQHEPDQDEHSQ